MRHRRLRWIEGKVADPMVQESTIESVVLLDEKKRRFALTVSGTSFHPSGGGQPGDSGELNAEGFQFIVDDAEMQDGRMVLSGRTMKGVPLPGMAVQALVDGVRHYLFSRMHTGEHILSRVLESAHEGLHVHKVAVNAEESAIFVTFAGEMDWPMLLEAEQAANEVIAEGRPVITEVLPKAEAEKLSGLKANWTRIEADAIRIVRIPDFDIIACSGSHVQSTGEVGDLFVTGFKGTAPEWEVKFTVEGKAARREYSAVARRLVRRIGCPLGHVEDVFVRLQEENSALTKAIERMAPLLSLPWDELTVEGYPLHIAVLPGFTKDLVAASAKRWSDGHPRAIVLALLPREKRGEFILYAGKDVDRNFSTFLRESPGLEARGGGRPDWLNGQSPKMTAEVWREALSNFLGRGRTDSSEKPKG